jgi:hypothetical protein
MGRVVLVNAVMDSQMVYFMSSLPLPPSVIHQLDKRWRGFMWSGSENGNVSSARCLVAWQKVCNSKELGGLGIKDIGTHNICLLLKLVHKLHFAESSAGAQWVSSRACLASEWISGLR